MEIDDFLKGVEGYYGEYKNPGKREIVKKMLLPYNLEVDMLYELFRSFDAGYPPGIKPIEEAVRRYKDNNPPITTKQKLIEDSGDFVDPEEGQRFLENIIAEMKKPKE